MMSSQPAPFGVDALGHGQAVLADRSCGTCRSCVAGSRLHCSAPSVEALELKSPVPAESAGSLAAAVLGAAAFVEAPRTAVVVVVADESSPLARLVRATTEASVIAASDLRDAGLREELRRLLPSGRADVVVAGDDVRAAVRSVRRGGHVCIGGAGTTLPSVTELVQREVSLVGPRDVGAFLRRIPDECWSEAVAAAA